VGFALANPCATDRWDRSGRFAERMSPATDRVVRGRFEGADRSQVAVGSREDYQGMPFA